MLGGSGGCSCRDSDDDCRSGWLCGLKLASRRHDRGRVLGQNIRCRQSALLLLNCWLILDCACLRHCRSGSQSARSSGCDSHGLRRVTQVRRAEWLERSPFNVGNSLMLCTHGITDGWIDARIKLRIAEAVADKILVVSPPLPTIDCICTIPGFGI